MPKLTELYCPGCHALNGHMSVEQAKKNYPDGCYYCSRANDPGTRATHAAAMAERKKAKKSHWQDGDGNDIDE